MTSPGSYFFYLRGDANNAPSSVFRGFTTGKPTEHGTVEISLDVDDIDRFCAFLDERGDHDVADDIRSATPDNSGYVRLHGAWATALVTRDDLETLERLANDARPVDDEDEGSERQIDAQNLLFEVLEHLEPRTFADDSDFAFWCLKATTEEIIDEGLRLIKQEPV